ncbi:unnamed protein product [Peniophora sp. CBMAI 1063]|nr:unnamed protein product [Peniophora sp. CBMAI 1063]
MRGKGKTRASPSASHSTWLPRGKACLNCRLRKIRCDGGTPICGPCRKDGRAVDCEYASNAPSSTHRLEQRVTELRARLRDLEPSSSSQGTSLHSPSPSVQGSQTPQPEELAVGHGDFNLSEADMVTLIDLFFEQEQPLWFLHRTRFHEAAQRPIDDPQRAHAALINIVTAIATRYATSDVAWLEAGLIDASLSALNNPLNTGGVGYENTIMQVLQARVLLGSVLAQMGRTLQSATVLESACALALALGLHNPNEGAALAPLGVMDPIAQQTLPSPTDNVSRAERTGAFWVTTIVESLWALARGAPPRVGFTRYQITTPWPITPERAEEPLFDIVSSSRGPQSVRAFIREGGPAPSWQGDNAVELVATATCLFAYSSAIARRAGIEEAHDVLAVEGHADAFALALGPALLADVRTHPAQVLVRGATLELHTNPGDPRGINAARALAAAAQTLLSPSSTLGFLEPVIGMVVSAACRALISARSTADTDEGVQDLEVTLNTLQGVLEAWAPQSAYIGVQLQRIQQERISSL